METVLSADYTAARGSTHSFEELGAFTIGDQNLTHAGRPTRVTCAFVTANFLSMLGVTPQLGRMFTAGEDVPGGPRLVLISDHLWRRQFNADPRVLLSTILLNGEKQLVIGVLPAAFRFPDLQLEPEVYAPQRLNPASSVSIDRVLINLNVIGRLRSGTTDQQALAEMRAFYAARAASYPAGFRTLMQGQQTKVEPLQRHLTGEDRKPLLILFAAVVLVLVTACANVANLQLARAGTRVQEISVRGALGASRPRLIQQLLVESLLISAMAAALGLVIAFTVTTAIQHTQLPESAQISVYNRVTPLLRLPFGKLSVAIGLDRWVLAFTATLMLATTLLFGLLPAFRGARPDLARTLGGHSSRISGSREQKLLRRGLLILEVGLGIILLSGAGLLTRSFIHVLRADPGFDENNLLTAVTLLSGNRYDHDDAKESLAQALLARLMAMPGVKAAAITSVLPLQPYDERSAFTLQGAPVPPMGMRPSVPVISVTPDYFRTAGTPLLEGRSFSNQDGPTTATVAIVNRMFALRNFQGNAIGKRFNLNSWNGDFRPVIIVGVAADTRHGGTEQPIEPEVYLPMAQLPQSAINLMVRSDADPAPLSNAMRDAVAAVDPDQPLFDVQTMEQRTSAALGRRRLMMLLLLIFAGLALVLSAVGVYGVFSYSVTQRVREIAIRLALGSRRSGVLRLVLAEAAALIIAGGLLGIAGGLFFARLLTSMLAGVSPHDAVSFCMAWLIMTAIGLGASYLPAAHAARLDPNAALHME
jgi:predicted permease